MLPALKIGFITIPTFGPVIFAGFLVAAFSLWRLAKEEGRNQEKVIDTMLLSVVAGLFFSRLVYVLSHAEIFWGDYGKWLLFLKYPGYSMLGAVMGISLVLIFESRSSLFGRRGGWPILDLFTVPAAIFAIFGSLACLFNGCLVGWPVFTPIFILLGYLLFTLVVSWIRGLCKKVPEVAKLLDRSGYVYLLFLIFTAGVNIPLARGGHIVIYYLWIALIVLSLGLFCLRYFSLTMTAIKFPARVLQQIKKYLENHRQETEKRLEDLKKEDPVNSTDRMELVSNDDEAHVKAGHERIQLLVSQMNMTLIEIRKALSKIKLGKYGICEVCGKMIDTDRLAAIPMATKCFSCAKKSK